MSNYPPGVSGFEPQIAGYPEKDETREVGECRRIGDLVVVSTPQHAQAGVTCTFEGGEVEGTLVGDPRSSVTFYWDCPVCGSENEVEVDLSDFEPDPDDARDRDLDA